MLNPFPQSFAP